MFILIVIVLLCVCSSIGRRLYKIWLLWFVSFLFSFISLCVLSLFVLFFIEMGCLKVSYFRYSTMSYWLFVMFVLNWKRIISLGLFILWCRNVIIFVFFVLIRMSELGRVVIFQLGLQWILILFIYLSLIFICVVMLVFRG